MKHASYVKKAELKFLFIVGIVVVLTGTSALMSILIAPELQTVVVKKIDSRSPASVINPTDSSSPQIFVAEKENSSTSLVQYNCDHKGEVEEVRGNYLRVTGLPCPDTEDMEITNQSNGFSAAVIFSKGNKFTTDFIDLKEGENNLEIMTTHNDGTKVSSIFKVVRRGPATIKK